MIKTNRGALYDILVVGETRLLRFIFGIVNIFFAIFMLNGAKGQWVYNLALQTLPAEGWAVLFIISGVALIYGAITTKYGYVELFFEGVLSSTAWVAMSTLQMIAQGSIGAVTIIAMVALYLFVRYPSFHDEKL